jgi:hypothetical protein
MSVSCKRFGINNNISIEGEIIQRFAIEIRDLKTKQEKKKTNKISKAKIGTRLPEC